MKLKWFEFWVIKQDLFYPKLRRRTKSLRNRSGTLDRKKHWKFIWWRVAAFRLRHCLHPRCACLHVWRAFELLGRETASERCQGSAFPVASDQVYRRRRARLVGSRLFVRFHLLPLRNSWCLWCGHCPFFGPWRHQHFPRWLRAHREFAFPRRIARLPCGRICDRGGSQTTSSLRISQHEQNPWWFQTKCQ